MPSTQRIILCTPPQSLAPIDTSALSGAGYEITFVSTAQSSDTWMIPNVWDALAIVAHPSAAEGLMYSAEIHMSLPLLPIILVTDEINQALLKQALEVGIVDYLGTPIDSPTLLGAIEHAMERKKCNQAWQPCKRVLDDLVDGFVLADLDSRLLIVNQSARTIFDISESKPEGKAVVELFYHPDFVDIFKPDRTLPSRNEISLRDGRVYSAQASLIPDIGVAVILQDITHLKELDRLKTDFVNTVSHDIRSPLTAIYGFIGLIDRVGPVNQQQAEFIRHIQSNVQHITSLINDLLDLSRMEAGYDLQMEDVHIKEILSQAIDNLQYQITEKMLDVELSVPEDVAVFSGIPLHLHRMVTNLVENAIKFTPPLGKIEVRCRPAADQLLLEVADNGPGIPLEDQPHIFEKFYRGSNNTQAIPGTGLGLSIVKSIVEKHQGRIWLESSPQGTTFSVLFPLK